MVYGVIHGLNPKLWFKHVKSYWVATIFVERWKLILFPNRDVVRINYSFVWLFSMQFSKFSFDYNKVIKVLCSDMPFKSDSSLNLVFKSDQVFISTHQTHQRFAIVWNLDWIDWVEYSMDNLLLFIPLLWECTFTWKNLISLREQILSLRVAAQTLAVKQ